MKEDDDLDKKLAELSARIEKDRTEERQREVFDIFEECEWLSMDAVDDETVWLDHGMRRTTKPEDDEPEEPMPIEKEVGRRLCRGCGAFKRNFDPGSDRCRACTNGPSGGQRAA